MAVAIARLLQVGDRGVASACNVAMESPWSDGKILGFQMRRKTADVATSLHALPTEQAQARRFGKARSARSTAILEDYVELIADLLESTGEARATDIARRLGVSHPTAINTITRLKREGLAIARPYRGIFLTEKGEALARRVRARHRVVLEMLLTLGVPRETAEADAEGIEHHVSEATLKAFSDFIKMPRVKKAS